MDGMDYWPGGVSPGVICFGAGALFFGALALWIVWSGLRPRRDRDAEKRPPDRDA